MPTPNTKKFHVTRIMSVLQSTTVSAVSEAAAVEASRKLKQNSWVTVDNKRRKNYKATTVEYPARG